MIYLWVFHLISLFLTILVSLIKELTIVLAHAFFFSVDVRVVPFIFLLIFIFCWVKISIVLFVVDWLWMFRVFCIGFGSLIGKSLEALVFAVCYGNIFPMLPFFFMEQKKLTIYWFWFCFSFVSEYAIYQCKLLGRRIFWRPYWAS